MDLRHAKEVASRIYAYGDGAIARLPSNIEIRELVGFLRSVIPKETFDHSLISTIQAEPLRIDASFPLQIRTQFNLANEIIERDHKLRQKLLGGGAPRPASSPQGSETFVVLSTFGYGLITVASLWRFGGYWQWLAMLVAVLIPVAVIAVLRKRSDGNGTVSDSCDSVCESTLWGDGGGGGDA